MMRRMTTWFLSAVATLALAGSASATKYAGEFMKIPIGARAIGMGGAFSAVADDATAPYWNPAGMVFLPYREVVVQHAEQFGSLLNHDVGSVVMPLKGENGHLLALGGTLLRLGADGIPVTPRISQLRPQIDFWDYGTDNDPTTTGNGQGNGVWDPGEKLLIDASSLYQASSSDYALMLSIARQRGTHWAYGANLKFVHSSIPDTLPGEHVTSFGAGVDVGTLWMPTDAITASAVAHDLTTTMLSWTNGTREFVGRVADGLDTEHAQPFDDVRHLHGLDHFGIELVDDWPWCARGCECAHPEADIEARQRAFGNSRYFRQSFEALGRADRQRAQSTGFDMGKRSDRIVKHE